jgi:hypothetical protein
MDDCWLPSEEEEAAHDRAHAVVKAEIAARRAKMSPAELAAELEAERVRQDELISHCREMTRARLEREANGELSAIERYIADRERDKAPAGF